MAGITQQFIHPDNYPKYFPENPWYPLPANYDELGPVAQKAARLAAVKKQDTPAEFVAAWDLFRRLYLQTTEPGFFYHNFVPSPMFHYEGMYDAALHGRNVLAAPRGSAKSIVFGTELPLFLLLTRPHIRIVLCLATDRLIERRFDRIMKQLTENPFIKEDFGEMKPPRGKGLWNRHTLGLSNGAVLEGFSVTGRKRGARPDIFILDDPEYDPESESSAQLLREKFDNFLFKQVIPMLEDGSSIYWIGTIIGRRSFLYYACHEDDVRFRFWNRKILSAWSDGPGETKEILWEGKWTEESLKAREAEMGSAAFATEFLNRPASAEDKTFVLDEVRNEYEVTEPAKQQTSALTANMGIQYHLYSPKQNEWVVKSQDWRDFVNGLYRLITLDPARGLAKWNDYSCIMVSGLDKSNCLWVLDMWMGRVKEKDLLKKLYEYGVRWQPKVMAIEDCGTQIGLLEAAETYMKRKQVEQGVWMPRVVAPQYKRGVRDQDKAGRIGTLAWRFEAGKIKYPRHLEQKWPFSVLYAQTRDFTDDLALLQHDDAIDALAMVQYVVRGRGVQSLPEPEPETPLSMIQRGELTVGGVPILSGFNTDEITPEMLQALLDNKYRKEYTEDQRSSNLMKIRRPYDRHRTNRRGRIGIVPS